MMNQRANPPIGAQDISTNPNMMGTKQTFRSNQTSVTNQINEQIMKNGMNTTMKSGNSNTF